MVQQPKTDLEFAKLQMVLLSLMMNVQCQVEKPQAKHKIALWKLALCQVRKERIILLTLDIHLIKDHWSFKAGPIGHPGQNVP